MRDRREGQDRATVKRWLRVAFVNGWFPLLTVTVLLLALLALLRRRY